MRSKRAKKIRKEARKMSKVCFADFLKNIHELSFLERLIIAWKLIRAKQEKD